MKTKFLILAIFLIAQISITAQHSIIPIPVNYTATDATFTFQNDLYLNSKIKDTEAITHINQLREFFTTKGIILIDKKSKKNCIKISLNKKSNAILGHEGYNLEVTEDNIVLSANKAVGIFNGIQTLKQLFPLNKKEIYGCNIKDYPRFKWRGLMLDVGRHFFTVDEVKSYINQMSEYKFNVLHWHLTDDHGWIIEIKALPKLTEVGAWRVKRQVFGEKPPQEGEKATDGGFYTQEQIKDIVKYAQDRNITIVPELDMPGHSMAALAWR